MTPTEDGFTLALAGSQWSDTVVRAYAEWLQGRGESELADYLRRADLEIGRFPAHAWFRHAADAVVSAALKEKIDALCARLRRALAESEPQIGVIRQTPE